METNQTNNQPPVYTLSPKRFSFFRGYLRGWIKFIVLKGRARRKEYWGFAFFNIIFLIIASIIDTNFHLNIVLPDVFADLGVGPVSGIYALAMIIPGLTITVRRLHDIGRSGWQYFWLVFAPWVALCIIVAINIFGSGGSFDYAFWDNIASTMDNVTIFIILFCVASLWYLIGSFILFIHCCTDSNPGDNQYGPNPKMI